MPESGHAPPLPLVAIKSIQWDRYLSLNGEDITQYQGSLRGYVTSQPYIAPRESFYLEHHCDGSLSFRSSVFPNVYMSLDGGDVQPHLRTPNGGGHVKAQFGAYGWEKFKIVRKNTTGAVAIESVAFPARFLSLGKVDQVPVVCVQGVALAAEQFEIVVIGW